MKTLVPNCKYAVLCAYSTYKERENMKHKKWSILIVAIMVAFSFVLILVSCDANATKQGSNAANVAVNGEIDIDEVYAFAQENGYVGTKEDFVSALKGDSAYEIAVAHGFVGSETEWLASLVGAAGKDGNSPTIGENGNWRIGDTDTGVKATGRDGNGIRNIEEVASDVADKTKIQISFDNGTSTFFYISNGTNGKDGASGTNGRDGVNGKDGKDGVNGTDGKDGTNGKDGTDGAPGNGIEKVEKTDSQGLVDTYTITFTDKTTTTFTIVNGKDGKDGANGTNGKDGQNGTNGKDGLNGENGKDGQNGVGIASIAKTGTNGLVDEYTINYTDGTHTTFSITNGADGKDGAKGETGAAGQDGAPGKDGQNGKDGVDGKDGQNGADGEDGVSIVGATINEQGELVLVFSDDSRINVGSVVGAKGDTGADGVSVTGARLENGELVLTIGEQDVNLGSIKGEKGDKGDKGDAGKDGKDGVNGTNGTNGADGKDGVSVVSVEIREDGHLYVTLSNSETPVDCGIVRDAHTHAFGDWIVLRDATCESKGLRTHVCSICGAVVGEEIAASTHSYENGVCTNCGDEQQFIATFMADGVTVAEIPFTVSTLSLEEPTVPQKDGYTGAWEEYTLSAQDVTVNAVYTEIQIVYEEITTKEELLAIAGKSGYYRLVNGLEFSERENLSAISSFAGVLDGNNNTIRNIALTDGAFVLSNIGTIKNLIFDDVRIRNAAGNVGTVAASNSGVIENCKVTNLSVVVPSECIGGLVGYNTGKIANSSVSGTVKCSNSTANTLSIGGLAGKSEGANARIENCFATASVIASVGSPMTNGIYMGGLVGQLDDSSVVNCYAAYKTNYSNSNSDEANIGGLVAKATDATLANCFGVCEENVGGEIATSIDGVCAAGSVTATNCYYSTELSSTVANCTAKSASDMKTSEFVLSTLGWSEDVWIVTNGDLPTLK